MSIRVRVTLLVAGIVAGAVLVGVTAAYYAIAGALHGQVDTFLTTRAARATQEQPGRQPPTLRRAPVNGPGPIADLDAVFQYVRADGSVSASGGDQPVLPVGEEDLVVARSSGSVLRDVSLDGTEFRMLTTSAPGGGAIQIARSLDEVEAVLASLRTVLVLVACGGTALAALVAWAVARRIARPIEKLSGAADRVARTQDLTAAIEVDRRDEVGQLAASFNTMLAALLASKEQQRRLVTDASHELRTPLTVVRTNIEFLQRAGGLDPEETARLLADTRLELEELTELVAELVDLATDVADQEPLEDVDLAELAGEVAARFARRTGRQVAVEAEASGTVRGRPAMLDRAVSNLVDNALKFSDPATSVEVSVRGGVIEVADRGRGIPAADADLVFERFYRSDLARTEPGSGLGLAIVRQISDVHGGSVSVRPREDGGTVARLEITAVPTPAAPR